VTQLTVASTNPVSAETWLMTGGTVSMVAVATTLLLFEASK
jgi:hypothetical protein